MKRDLNIDYNIDANFVSDDANAKRLYEAKKMKFTIEAKNAWKVSEEAIKLKKVTKHLLGIFGLIFFIIFFQIGGIFMALLASLCFCIFALIVVLIIRKNKRKNFINLYVSSKIVDDYDNK